MFALPIGTIFLWVDLYKRRKVGSASQTVIWSIKLCIAIAGTFATITYFGGWLLDWTKHWSS